MLGARLLVEEGDDVAEVAAAVAAERGTTYMLHRPAARCGPGSGRLRESLAERLIRKLPGVDVRIVADRSDSRGAVRLSCRARGRRG